jgi:hypothetical protein
MADLMKAIFAIALVASLIVAAAIVAIVLPA